MELILNGELCPVDDRDCLNLAELIARAEALEADGEPAVVVAVEVDGEALSPDELDRLELRPLERVARVRVERRPSREIALGVLQQGADYTQRIRAFVLEIVGDYRDGKSENANRGLADVLDSLTVLTGITYSIAAVLVDAATELAALQGEIQPWLEEMLEAQTEEDLIRIADLLEYEIAPRIGQWGEAMARLSSPSARAAASR
jgi:hypothetical protein